MIYRVVTIVCCQCFQLLQCEQQRRKMRKLARLAAEGRITLKEFQTQYKSWRGDKKRYNAYNTLRRLDSEERKLEKWIRSTHST